jgi:hypothetical protein
MQGVTNRGRDDAARDGAPRPGRPPAPRADPHREPAAGPSSSGGEGEGRRRPHRSGGPAASPGERRRRPREHAHGLHRFHFQAEHAVFWIRGS